MGAPKTDFALPAGFHMHGAKPVGPGELAVVILSLINQGDAGRVGQLINDAIAYARACRKFLLLCGYVLTPSGACS